MTIVSPTIGDHKVESGEDLGSEHFPIFSELNICRQLMKNESIVYSKYKVKKADYEMFHNVTYLRLAEDEADTLEGIERTIHGAAERAIPKTRKT